MIRLLGAAAAFSLIGGCDFSGAGGGTGDTDATPERPTFATGHAFRKAVQVEPSVESPIGSFVLAVTTIGDADLARAASEDGSDIMLTEMDSDDALAIEIESYNPSTGALTLWVERQLRSETLHLYYGRAGAAPRPILAWPDHVCGVWHGRVVADQAVDSSVNGLDAERTPDGVIPEVIDGGAIGSAIDMEATSAQFTTSSEKLRFQSDSFTYSAWVRVLNPGSGNDQPWNYGGQSAAVAGYSMALGSGPWRASVAGSGDFAQSDFGSFDDFVDTWTFVVAVVDRDTDELRTYTNGEFVSSAAIAAEAVIDPSVDSVAHIGGDSSLSTFIGTLDEVRVIEGALGVERIRAQFANIADPAFLTFGEQEAPPE